MKNPVQCGDLLEFTAPAGGVISGNAYLIGSLVVVAEFTANAGERFVGATEGVFTLPKAAVAWTEGQNLYWDSAAANFSTATSGTARRAAWAVTVAVAADTVGLVKLNNVGAPVNLA